MHVTVVEVNKKMCVEIYGENRRSSRVSVEFVIVFIFNGRAYARGTKRSTCVFANDVVLIPRALM